MKFLTFDYVDAKGKISKRQVIQLSAPQENYFCVDVAELEPVEMFDLQEELAAAEKDAKELRDEILARFDISKNYRFFNPAGMTNVVEED